MNTEGKDIPLVSIIIPNYNREGLIGETLDSIKNQSYSNWECIIVDDGSTDNSSEVIHKYIQEDTRFKYFERPSNRPKGANACRNFGFEKSLGEFIQWFDSDDLMKEEYLQTMISSFDNTIDVAICSFYRFGPGSEDAIYNNNLDGDPWELFYNGQLTFNTQPYLYRKAKIENVRYDESLSRAQDLDYVFRAFRDSITAVRYVPKMLIKLRQHPDTITAQFKKKKTPRRVKDELKVRRNIMEYAATREGLKSFYPAALKKYMIVLRKAVSNRFLSIFIKELFSLKLNMTEKFKFLYYGLVIYFSGKGMARFYKYLDEVVAKRT